MIKIFIVILLEILIFIPQNGSIDFRIEPFLKPKCQPPMYDMDLRNCDMMPVRRLEFSFIPNSENIDGTVLSDQGDNKVCEKFCLNDIRCYGIMTRSTYAHGRCMLYGVGSHYLRSSSLYDTHVLTCCYYEIDKASILDRMTNKNCSRNVTFTKECLKMEGFESKWLALKGIEPINEFISSHPIVNDDECRDECIKHKQCFMIKIETKITKNCYIYDSIDNFHTTSLVNNTYILFCCGSKIEPDDRICEKPDTREGMTCHKFCAAKYQECVSQYNMKCRQLCKNCMNICKQALIDNR